MGDDYESVLCAKQEVMIYRIPPLGNNRGYRAADWGLDNPAWTGRLKVVGVGKNIFVRFFDKDSGDLYAECPIENHAEIVKCIEPVSDSSRFFVARLKDRASGRNAFVGFGFSDRSDSFDMNVSIQDHFKRLQLEKEIAENPVPDQPKLDLQFGANETIKINIPKKEGASDSSRARPKPSGGGGGILLPPPPPAGSRVPRTAPVSEPAPPADDFMNF